MLVLSLPVFSCGNSETPYLVRTCVEHWVTVTFSSRCNADPAGLSLVSIRPSSLQIIEVLINWQRDPPALDALSDVVH